ncbi:MAG: ribosomal protein S18 acetylase RimI-like enzyme [Flavobacterium sp.]|jgi:ribosomal protein S18 acetylase RimI-like enzyme
MTSQLLIQQLSLEDSVSYGLIREMANSDKNYRGHRDKEKTLSPSELKVILNFNQNAISLGAFLHNELVGIISMGWLLEESTLFGLFVTNACRRQGIGRKLSEKVVQLAGEKASKVLKLEVLRENASALALYESMGFSSTRRNQKSLKMILVTHPPPYSNLR